MTSYKGEVQMTDNTWKEISSIHSHAEKYSYTLSEWVMSGKQAASYSRRMRMKRNSYSSSQAVGV